MFYMKKKSRAEVASSFFNANSLSKYIDEYTLAFTDSNGEAERAARVWLSPGIAIQFEDVPFLSDDSNLCSDFLCRKEGCKKELCKKQNVDLGSGMTQLINFIKDLRSPLDVCVSIITLKDVSGVLDFCCCGAF